jgi:hypothetical protein
MFVTDKATPEALEPHRLLQAQLADPRKTTHAEESLAEAINRGKIVVLITCSIHSSETASTYMAMKLAYELARGTDQATTEILKNVVLAIVPSANPDGVQIVADWYTRSRGMTWEGGGLPRLYHPYAGHDTNRDWFMLNLVETRLLTRFLYQEWFPTIAYDVHEMNRDGARLFVPPFYDPVNPNLDPRIHEGIDLIGSHMSAALASAGKQGILTSAIYDNWWEGGNRTTPQRHNIVAVLTEAASVKLATPVRIGASELRGGARGFADHRAAANFVDPWPGGWWRLQHIVDYEYLCARSLLTLAARYKEEFQRNYSSMAAGAIAKGETEAPFGWAVPRDQPDPGRAAELVRRLQATGIEVHETREGISSGAKSIPAGTWVMLAAQPYRAHLKDMMERQVYPAKRGPNGQVEPPYDVAGWTFPLLMGVEATSLEAPPDRSKLELVKEIVVPGAGLPLDDQDVVFPFTTNDSFAVLEALCRAGVAVNLLNEAGSDATAVVSARPRLQFRSDSAAREALAPHRSRYVTFEPVSPGSTVGRRVVARRIGLYHPFVASMDEGWTRFVLESFGLPYETIHNEDITEGNLETRVDVLILPSVQARVIRDGFARGATAPEYVGGLGDAGGKAIRRFVEAGGTLVALEDSAKWAIDGLGLPLKELVSERPRAEFFGPGSIVRVENTAPAAEVMRGVPQTFSAHFDRSLAFESTDSESVQVLARYGPGNPLESGYLHGPEHIAGKAAIVRVVLGQGEVVAYGFPPQHRGQTHGTFRLLLNSAFHAVAIDSSTPAPASLGRSGDRN